MSNPLTAARGTNPAVGGALRCVLPRLPKDKLRPSGRLRAVRVPKSWRRAYP